MDIEGNLKSAAHELRFFVFGEFAAPALPFELSRILCPLISGIGSARRRKVPLACGALRITSRWVAVCGAEALSIEIKIPALPRGNRPEEWAPQKISNHIQKIIGEIHGKSAGFGKI